MTHPSKFNLDRQQGYSSDSIDLCKYFSTRADEQRSNTQRTGLDPMIDSGLRDLTGRIQLLLAESPIADVRHIRVERQGDQVLLQGRVRSFYAKQMAQETIKRAAGNLQIVNSVSVD